MAQQEDIDRWSEEIAGRRAPGVPDVDGAEALRGAIRAEDARAAAEGAHDRVGLERLQRRLESEGLLDAARPPAAAHSRRMRPWLAAAATVAALAIGIRLFMPQPGVEPGTANPPGIERPRGFEGVLKQAVPDTEAAASNARQELQALGLDVSQPPAEGRIILEVDVGPEKLDAYRAWAEARGGRVNGAGRYRVIFEPAS